MIEYVRNIVQTKLNDYIVKLEEYTNKLLSVPSVFCILKKRYKKFPLGKRSNLIIMGVQSSRFDGFKLLKAFN